MLPILLTCHVQLVVGNADHEPIFLSTPTAAHLQCAPLLTQSPHLPQIVAPWLQSSQRQHVPMEEYASNLDAILREARAAGIKHLLLITPPPVHEPGRVAHQQLVS
jgi:hypothetical protein